MRASGAAPVTGRVRSPAAHQSCNSDLPDLPVPAALGCVRVTPDSLGDRGVGRDVRWGALRQVRLRRLRNEELVDDLGCLNATQSKTVRITVASDHDGLTLGEPFRHGSVVFDSADDGADVDEGHRYPRGYEYFGSETGGCVAAQKEVARTTPCGLEGFDNLVRELLLASRPTFGVAFTASLSSSV